MWTRRALLWSPVALWGAEEWVAADGSAFPRQSWKLTSDGMQAVGSLDTFQDIKTVRLFEEFEFEFEWKMLPEGNSGVKYQLEKWDRWQPQGLTGWHIRARGAELQLVDDERNPDAQRGPVKQCGALYGKIGPKTRARVRIGEFNQARIVLRGKRVQHWINNELLVEYELEQVRPSAVALQNHKCDVWFRNLKLRG